LGGEGGNWEEHDLIRPRGENLIKTDPGVSREGKGEFVYHHVSRERLTIGGFHAIPGHFYLSS